MKRPFFFLAAILCVFIIAFRFFVKEDRVSAGHISNFISERPRHLAVKARVVNDPYYQHAYFNKTQVFIVSPELVKVSRVWFPAYGNIRVASSGDKEVRYGDEILFEAKLESPSPEDSGSFDYKKYLERSGVFGLAKISEKDALIITGRKRPDIKSAAYDFKNSMRRNFESLFKAPERYFISAILLGERQEIPKEWKDIFINTQTMHLLAISGLHVGIIASIALFVIGLFGAPRPLKYGVTIALLIFYAVMVGGRPSVVRATVMAAAILGAYILKKDADIYNSLGLAAAAILIFNPDQLFEASFILSFISVLSIVYMTPRINRFFGIEKIARTGRTGIIYYILTLASASFAVWIGLLPLAAIFFNIISLISVLVNILAIPLVFIIISLSITALIFQPVLYFLGTVFAEATELFVAVLLSALKFFSDLPLAYFEVRSTSIPAALLYYLIIISFLERRESRQNRV